jgi:hypothetical protein
MSYSGIPSPTPRLPPIEVRPHLCPALAASDTDETLLDIRLPQIVRRAIGAERHGMAATIVGAIDQDAAHAHLAHLAEGDFLRTRCEHYFDFVFSPISTSRRMASERAGADRTGSATASG